MLWFETGGSTKITTVKVEENEDLKAWLHKRLWVDKLPLIMENKYSDSNGFIIPNRYLFLIKCVQWPEVIFLGFFPLN